MNKHSLEGLVIRRQSGFYWVQTAEGLFPCKLRGRLKRVSIAEDIVAVGDHVSINLVSDGTGVIEKIEPRKNALLRLAPTARGEFKQVLLANLDQAVFVFACTQPDPSLRMLDRFLVIAEKHQIPSLIVVNKIDLLSKNEARQIFAIYESLHYATVYTSAKTGKGVRSLEKQLIGKTSALAGPSGVGKTSLLNYIQPELGLNIRDLKKATHKGRHTTVVREMFALEKGGYVADMPGLRQLSLWDTQPEELDGYFPELRELVAECQFNDCSHRSEPGCAVKKAVEEGKVHPERYESYLRMRSGIEEADVV